MFWINRRNMRNRWGPSRFCLFSTLWSSLDSNWRRPSGSSSPKKPVCLPGCLKVGYKTLHSAELHHSHITTLHITTYYAYCSHTITRYAYTTCDRIKSQKNIPQQLKVPTCSLKNFLFLFTTCSSHIL